MSTVPSQGAQIFPSEGITATPLPSIPEEKVGSGTSVTGTAWPDTGAQISSYF